MSEQESYQALLSDLVKKQMMILGPQVALSVAGKVSLLTVGNDGQVTAINGNCQTALRQLVNEYSNLTGKITFSTLQSLVGKYPDIKNID